MIIKNKFLAPIFDTFDLPIRYLYTHAGPISTGLNKMMFWKLYASDFSKLDAKFTIMYDFLQKNKLSLKDKYVLELGPGNSYINAYNFLMLGAKKVYLVDKYPRHNNTKAQKKFMKDELEFIAQKYGVSKLPFIGQDGSIDQNYIEFIPKDLTDTTDLHVDFIYSISVLEHIKDIGNNIMKMADILNPGGYMYHRIDMRDHFNFNNPFLFYKYSDRTWENYCVKEGLSYTNRWRYDDFMKAFGKLNIIYEEIEKYPLPKNIGKKFIGRNSLDIGVLSIILQK
jgi:SAM-dependent methyltransferase